METFRPEQVTKTIYNLRNQVSGLQRNYTLKSILKIREKIAETLHELSHEQKTMADSKFV